jgi:hypothetical protein
VKVSVRTENHDLVLEVWNAGDPIPAPFHRQQSRRLGVPLEASLQ